MVILPSDDDLSGRSEREWAEDMDRSMGYVRPQKELVERAWVEEVLPAVTIVDEKGRTRISIEKLKGEMYDLLWARDTAQKVYHTLTGGITANLTISSEGIIAMVERVIEDRIEQAVAFALARRDQ